MDKETSLIPLETVEFIARHPWYFILPFIIVICITISYVTNIPDLYQSEAVVSFGTANVEVQPQKFAQRKQSLVARVLFGNNIRKIIAFVWPKMSEETNSKRYVRIVSQLQNPREGINIQFETLDPSLAHISCRDRSPEIAYNVVQATINVIKVENNRIVEESVDSSSKYLTNQLKIYKDKITAIDSEMLTVSAKVKEMMSALNAEQKELIYKTIDETSTSEQYGDLTVSEEAVKADDLAKLNSELSEAKRLRKTLEMRLEKKDFAPVITKSQDIQEEVFTKAIEEKKLLTFELTARGYLPEHPDMKKLQKGIDELMALREKQLREKFSVDSRTLSASEVKLAEMTLKSEIKKLDIAIEALRNNKEAMESYYRESAEKTPVAGDSLLGMATAEAAKLGALKAEKTINSRYYTDFRKQLEDANLRSREEEGNAGFVISVVDLPKVPRIPIPRKRNNRFFMGMILAVGAGIAIAYVVDFLDKSVRSAAELRKKFSVPVIASIEMIYTSGDITAARIQRNLIAVSMLVLMVVSMIATRIFMKVMNIS